MRRKLCLALGLLLVRSDRGLTALVARDGQGGRLARRMLPLALVTPAMITTFLWQRRIPTCGSASRLAAAGIYPSPNCGSPDPSD